MPESSPRAKNYLNPICYLTIGLLGLYLSVYQSVISEIAADFRLSAGLTGLMISFHFLGSFLLPILFGEAGDHLGTRPVLRLSFLILVAGLACVVFGRSPAWFLAGTLLVGGGFAVLEGMLSGLLTVANPDRVNSVMNVSQMYFCLGAVAGPFLVQGFQMAGQGWRTSFGLLLTLFAICMILAERLHIPAVQVAPIRGLYLRRLLRDRVFVMLLVSIFIYVGVEEGAAFWVTSYIQAQTAVTIPSRFYLAAYWLGMAIGRWLFSRLVSRLSLWLNSGLILAGVCLGLFLWQQQPVMLLVWLFLAGFGFAPAWPVLMARAARRSQDATNTAMGSMMALGAAGGMALPFALGQLADTAGLDRAMLLLPSLLVILLAVLLLAEPVKKQM